MKVDRCLALLVAAVCGQLPAEAADESPVRKVVTLLSEMKRQVEKDTAADERANANFKCWCTTNEAEKTASVEAARSQIAELEASIERATFLEAQLKTEMSSLASGIEADRDALQKATDMRGKDVAAFRAESEDLKESIAAVREALTILSKVQLLQREGRHPDTKPLLLQLRGVFGGVDARLGRFRSVMQRDLWDVMSSVSHAAGGGGFLPRGRALSALESRRGLHRRALQPEAPAGSAAGAKSYNSRSGSIVGVIAQLKDGFEKSLGTSQRDNLEALIQFHALRSSKLAEIAEATAQKGQKEATLVEIQDGMAQAREDLMSTKDALAADQKFLLELGDSCTANREEYAERQKLRSEEVRALGETIKILEDDGARDLFGKSLSFVQTQGSNAAARSAGGHLSGRRAALDAALGRAAGQILRVARTHNDWVFASLAVHLRLDAFSKVKEAMDKMLAELAKQQKEESAKWESCKLEVDETEDDIKRKRQAKEDLGQAKLGLENDIGRLESEIDGLRAAVRDTTASLKEAGEERKAESAVFQQSVADQRATIQVLKKAQERLKAFYAKAALLQSAARTGAHRQQPGASPPPPPPKGPKYAKNEGAGGVMQLLDMIMQDAGRTEAELVAGEQHAQASYATFAGTCKSTIDADTAALAEKSAHLQRAMAAKSETEEMLLSNGEELSTLEELLRSVHLDCDYLLEHYRTRQAARSEEMSAIKDAKAILSGADFGSEAGEQAKS